LLERLGKVLYWACCIIAALFAAGAVAALMSDNDRFVAFILAPAALAVYGIGWALRYVLVGR
jgi:hypothetical protein